MNFILKFKGNQHKTSSITQDYGYGLSKSEAVDRNLGLSLFGASLVTIKGSNDRLPKKNFEAFIKNHVAVYLSHDSKIVGTDTINGSEVFSYDVGGKPAHNLAPIGEGKFLSVHSGVVYLWSMDPKEDRQKPLMQWVHSSFADHSIPMGLIVMGPDLFVVTTSEVASVFNLVF